MPQKNSMSGKKPTISTQSFLDIYEIKDNTVVMKDGTLRSVLLVSSINFSLKSEEEQNAIIQAYVQFLNSLSHPMQIVIQSRKLDIDRYLDHLKDLEKQQVNELLKTQMADYRNYINELLEMAEIMTKRFYITVPYDAKAFTQASYAGTRISILSGYYDSLNQLAKQVHKEKVEDDSLLIRLCDALSGNRLACVISELVAIGASPDLEKPVQENAKETIDHLQKLEPQLYELFIKLQVDKIISPYPNVTSAWIDGITCVQGIAASPQELEQIKEKLDSLVCGDGWVMEIDPG